MDGAQPYSQLFLYDPCAKAHARRRDYSVRILPIPENVVKAVNIGDQDMLGDACKRFGRVPQAGIRDGRFRFLNRAESDEIQPGIAHLPLEKLVGNDGGVMATALQFRSEFNHWMDVSSA